MFIHAFFPDTIDGEPVTGIETLETVIRDVAESIVDTLSEDMELAACPPSLRAVVALTLARMVLNVAPAWSTLLQAVSGYSYADIQYWMMAAMRWVWGSGRWEAEKGMRRTVAHIYLCVCLSFSLRSSSLVESSPQAQSQTAPTASTPPMAAALSPLTLATQSSSDSGFYSPGHSQSAMLDDSSMGLQSSALLQGADSAGAFDQVATDGGAMMMGIF